MAQQRTAPLAQLSEREEVRDARPRGDLLVPGSNLLDQVCQTYNLTLVGIAKPTPHGPLGGTHAVGSYSSLLGGAPASTKGGEVPLLWAAGTFYWRSRRLRVLQWGHFSKAQLPSRARVDS